MVDATVEAGEMSFENVSFAKKISFLFKNPFTAIFSFLGVLVLNIIIQILNVKKLSLIILY